jgi:hypothetical protein
MPSAKKAALRSKRTAPELESFLYKEREERAILGAILLRPSEYSRTTSLRIDEFTLPAHRTIYQRMRDLIETERPIDEIALAGELGRHGELEAIGGCGFVAGLLDGVPDNTNVDYYVRVVREAAALRKLYGLTESIPKLLAQPGSLQQVISHIDGTLTAPRLLARQLQRGSLAPSKQAALSGSTLLKDIVSFVHRFVGLTAAQGTVVALWVVHTHAFDASDTTPYLAITSAEKQSGKTRLLEVLKLIVASPWFTGRVTAAVLVRKVDADAPTLLLDETDAAFNSDREYAESLRGILNSGYRRGGAASLCVGKGVDIQAKDFQTFCPKAFAGLGRLPDTVAARSIPIRLKRKAPGEGEIERFRERLVEPQALEIEGQIAAWAGRRLKDLEAAQPDLPEALSDRQQDCIEPLLAIADAAGEEWPDRARHALVEVLRGAAAEDQSFGVKLLADICQIFDERADKLFSRELVAALVAIETSPWAEISHGKPLTAPKLSLLLKPFEIGPRSIRINEETGKGYLRESFEDARKRYLWSSDTAPVTAAPQEPSQPSQRSNDAAVSASRAPSHSIGVTASRNEEKPVMALVVTDVTEQVQEESAPAILKGVI